MAASPVFQSAASGRPFVLFPQSASLLTQLRDTPKLAAITPASRLEVRLAPEMVSSGIPELDALTGGWPRGCLSEICGPVSSGRTSVLLAALARATQRGEACALVDASDALDPASAAAAGIEMGRLLWVRCGKKNSPRSHPSTSLRTGSVKEKLNQKCLKKIFLNETEFTGKGHKTFEQQLEQVLKVTDLLLQSNGFGMIVLDLADIPVRSARRIPLASWFRFRRAVENTPTVLLVIEEQPIAPHQAKNGLDGGPGLAGSCSSVLLRVSGGSSQVSGARSQLSGKKPSAFSSQHSDDRDTDLARAKSSDLKISENGKFFIERESSGDRKTEASCPPHMELLDRFEITAALLRSRLERKPVQPVANFRSRAKWAG